MYVLLKCLRYVVPGAPHEYLVKVVFARCSEPKMKIPQSIELWSFNANHSYDVMMGTSSHLLGAF